MPKKRQIPYLSEVQRAHDVAWWWKPSPRLRACGWKAIDLGTDRKKAILAAMARNDELAEWEASRLLPVTMAAPRHRIRWNDLLDRYYGHGAFRDRKPKTQAEYRSRLRTLTVWAQDGDIPVADIDREMVLDLRRQLVTHPSRFRTAALLRVLGIFLQFAEDEGIISTNPATRLKIPTPAPRRRRIMREELHWLLDAAGTEMQHIADGIVLGFYTMQREGDLLNTTAFQLAPLRDISPEARRVLGDANGDVLGLRLQQEKTGTWVSNPLHPLARQAVMATLGARASLNTVCTHLIRYPGEDRNCPEWKFQRDFATVRAKAIKAATQAERPDIVERLTGIMFRDFRRSGMCWMRDLGVSTGGIANLSGHSIKQTHKILDTYMPADERGAADAMAMAVVRQSELDQINIEKQGG